MLHPGRVDPCQLIFSALTARHPTSRSVLAHAPRAGQPLLAAVEEEEVETASGLPSSPKPDLVPAFVASNRAVGFLAVVVAAGDLLPRSV